jgi:uncharacterized protein YpmB
MSPQSPKTEADEKIEGHFNGIVIAVLAIMALAILIAIFFFFHKGSKVVPSAHRQSAVVRPVDLESQTTVRISG